MNELLIFLSGLLAGAFIYSVFYRILGVGASILLFRQVEMECLHMLALSLEDAAFMKTAKHKIMQQFDYDPNAVKITINEDDFTIEKWKKTSVSRLLDSYPTNLAGLADYNDWGTAMKYLNENSYLLKGGNE